MKIINFISSREITVLVKDIMALNEQIFQIQRDKIKLQQRMNELSFERKKKDNDKNILIEIDNIQSLLEEYDIRYNTKFDELKLLENELNSIESSLKSKYEYDKTSSSMFQRKKVLANNDNVFNSNYVEKLSSRGEFPNFDRKARTKEEVGSYNREKILEIADYNSGQRAEKYPTNENKFKRSRSKII
jgi:hypothetical protein